jgi:hypothetical protein
MDSELELKDVVRKLREDLQAAAEEGQGKGIRFKLESIDLELKVAAKREGGPNGKIKFSVLGIGAEVGGSAKWAAEQVQTIKLKMVPETANGNSVKVDKKAPERPGTPEAPGGRF